MNVRPSLLLPLTTVVVLAVAVLTGRVSHAEQPNVILIYTDDQGTVDANCYGSRDLITPTIDGLAASYISKAHNPLSTLYISSNYGYI